MPQRSNRSRSPKRVGGAPEAWPLLCASLDRVNEALHALEARGEAEIDYLSNTQRVQLVQRLDRIAEELTKVFNAAQLGVVNLDCTKSQSIDQKRIEYVRLQISDRQEHMANLARSVSLMSKDPVPSDVRKLREALANVERGQKEARNHDADLMQFMVDLDNISGLPDEARRLRKNTISCIDSLVASIDQAKDQLLTLHEMLDEELEKQQETERLANLDRTKSQAIGHKRIEYVRFQINERQEHMANLARSVSLMSKDPVPSDVRQLREALANVERGQKEARNHDADLMQFMMDLDNISGLPDEDRNFRKNTIACISSLEANIDQAKDRLLTLHDMLDKELKKRQEQELWTNHKQEDELISEPAKLGLVKLDCTKSQEIGQKRIEYVRSQISERQEHMANLSRSISLMSKNPVPSNVRKLREALANVERGQKEARNYDTHLTQFMVDLDNISGLPDEDRNFRKNTIACISSLEANIDQAKDRLLTLHGMLDKELKKRQDQEEREKKATAELARRTEADRKPPTSTQPPLPVPSGPPKTLAPRSAQSYARMDV